MHFSQRLSVPLVLPLCLTSLGGSAQANDVETGFEFPEVFGTLTVGDSPRSVSFEGGLNAFVGIPGLYHNGFYSYLMEPGEVGVATLETPAETLSFFTRATADTPGLVQLLDSQGNVVFELVPPTDGFVEVNRPAGAPPIAQVIVSNLDDPANGGYVVFDDFSFCAIEIGTPLDDPIPGPIRQIPVPLRLEPLAGGLTAPNWGASAPGEPGSLYVSDQTGILSEIDLFTGDRRTFLDASSRLVDLGVFGPGSFDERGLLGFAFHPDYANNRLLYTYTSEATGPAADFTTQPEGTTADHQSVILEWTAIPSGVGSQLIVDPNSARELLRVDQPQFNHNGGALSFGPDGMLYIAFGDGGGADDRDGQFFLGEPMIGHGLGGNGQDLSNPLGSILRIDPSGTNSANGSYGIPSDNPFVGAAGLDEIFAYGLRNPFRFSFDSLTGELYVADVGQNDIEEVSLVTSGDNLGWPLREGRFFFSPNGNLPGFVTDVDLGGTPELVDPFLQYDHDEGVSVIGGFVYRGSAIPALQGVYFFGEYASTVTGRGRLMVSRGGVPNELLTPDETTSRIHILGFGQDAAGEIYVLGNETGVPSGTRGGVFRLVL